MKYFFAVSILIFGSAFVSYAQPNLPSFNQYAVKAEGIRNISVNLSSHKNARNFRTNLRNSAGKGVNFAGHFVIGTWGCGTNCTESGIIDGRTGRVFFPPELQGAGSGFCDLPDDRELLTYHANSRLLVLSGFKNGEIDTPNSPCGIYYLEWTGVRFRQVRFIRKTRFN